MHAPLLHPSIQVVPPCATPAVAACRVPEGGGCEGALVTLALCLLQHALSATRVTQPGRTVPGIAPLRAESPVQCCPAVASRVYLCCALCMYVPGLGQVDACRTGSL